MKILHLNTDSSGGSYEYAQLLSTGLVEEGNESRVVCRGPVQSENGHRFLDRLARRAATFFSIEPWHGTMRFSPAPSLRDLGEIDVVHLHTLGDWYNVPKWLHLLPKRASVVVTLHDLWHVSGGCFLYRGCDRFSGCCSPCPILKSPIHRLMARRELKWKTATYRARRAQLVANSHWLAGLIREGATARACGGVRVIPPAIDTEVFQPRDKGQCRDEMGLPRNRFVIVTGCASLTDTNKNMTWLLDRLAQLGDQKDILVLAFGEGRLPVPDGLEVRFTGVIKDRRFLATMLAAGDVFVSASQMETYGMVLVEAMACGTPVVAFQVGGIPEAAPHGIAGILCPKLDAPAFVNAITELRSCPPVRQKLGRSASELALSRNGSRTLVQAYSNLYRDSQQIEAERVRE